MSVDSKEETEPFSKGFGKGSVYLVSSEEETLYPGAEVVKTITTEDPFEVERSFLELAVAGKLFPGRFIEVVGHSSSVEPYEVYGIKYVNYQQKLFSKKANIPTEHDQFTTDMVRAYEGSGKVSTCTCPVCTTHRGFHEQYRLEKAFEEWHGRMAVAGIIPAGELDASDYCMTPDGIIFFELRNFFPKKVSSFLDSNRGTISGADEISKMLSRYSEIPTSYQVTGRLRR